MQKYLFFKGSDTLPLWFYFSYVLIASGSFVQAFCIYVLSAYVGRSYLEIKGRPPYLIMEIVGKADNESE